ncbi:major facilitator superfamily domain-containing protein [Vararia minispora EC-137]|uniref:Major facilitator superfamily domain-containing protein n=1 Tax=Vararia minispora EC-137 TaxID=1314806 RepID=A0ACB8QGW7_9AGAM|nr:major facilitator superfamily domain-containing protein [Vararia minispora EC-137]
MPLGEYKMYKRRWCGTIAMFVLEVVASMTWPWFGPISSTAVEEFGFTLDEVNWLGNIISCAYLIVGFLTPYLVRRVGVRYTCYLASLCLLISGWIRYAGTAKGLSKNGAYALIILGQFFSGMSQPVYQILAPKYSELWFDLNSRTTATMLVSIANPIGGAIGQILSPTFSTVRQSILVLAIISTAVIPVVILVPERPPTPPTYAGSKPSPPISTLLFAMLGREPETSDAYMTRRERLDFGLLLFIFSVLLSAINTLSVLTNQWLTPYGYSDNTAGLMGAALLIAGIIAALVTAPLFDRVFTHHLSLTIRVLCPTIGVAWFSLIWAVRSNNAPALYVLFALIGGCSIALLPMALELAVELTRNADGSSAALWWSGNLFCIIFITSQGALRAPLSANPPQNMHRAIIFNGVWCLVSSVFIFALQGHQVRRQKDEQMMRRETEGGGGEKDCHGA